jgi:hypothetical protein
MADATLTSVSNESMGSMRLITAKFSNIDDTNTWGPKLQGVIGYWCNPTDDSTTQTSNVIDVTWSDTTQTFTFSCGEDGRAGTLYVLTKS